VDEPVLLVDDPAPKVRRFTLNRPAKRNALSDALRSALFDGLREGDRDPGVSVMIIRGGGECFCAGYDLSAPNRAVERSTAPLDGWWSRHVVAGWFELMDMATPLIAQVHGWCLAGGTELAAACDLVYVARDAQIGYPPVRLMSPPDLAWQPWLLGMRRAMEALLTGDAMDGDEAVSSGFANRAFERRVLDAVVIEVA
jgi:enoyl-CoA hydratase